MPRSRRTRRSSEAARDAERSDPRSPFFRAQRRLDLGLSPRGHAPSLSRCRPCLLDCGRRTPRRCRALTPTPSRARPPGIPRSLRPLPACARLTPPRCRSRAPTPSHARPPGIPRSLRPRPACAPPTPPRCRSPRRALCLHPRRRCMDIPRSSRSGPVSLRLTQPRCRGGARQAAIRLDIPSADWPSPGRIRERQSPVRVTGGLPAATMTCVEVLGSMIFLTRPAQTVGDAFPLFADGEIPYRQSLLERSHTRRTTYDSSLGALSDQLGPDPSPAGRVGPEARDSVDETRRFRRELAR
jgi:hypothetical protein